MSMYSRRQFLSGAGALGAATACPGIWAATLAQSGLSSEQILRLEAQAAGFSNPLRLPGSSGLFGVLPATDFKEVHVVRSEIEVLPGRRTPVLAYAVESGGRKFLNPALLARRGDEMRVKLINHIDQPTVIHWHGLGVDSRNDGNGLNVVAPGQSMDYAFALQDRSSMYWYHPHAHGYIPQQAYHGLASLLFVEDDDETALRKELDLALGDTEIPLVLQDREFDAQGRLLYAPTAAQSFGGWVGNRLLVNLTEQPFIEAGRRIVRFRILNGSNARSYRLAFLQQGRALGFYLAGSDGGLLAQPVRIDQTFLSPGQRLDVLVDFREAEGGRPVTLASLPFDPMHQEGGHDMAAMDHSQHGAAQGTSEPATMAMEGDARALMRANRISGIPVVANGGAGGAVLLHCHGGKGRSGMSMKAEDAVSDLFVANTHTPLIFFSSHGQAYKEKVWRLPLAAPNARGKALVNMLPLEQGERITTVMPLPEDEASWANLNIVFATEQGMVRREAAAHLQAWSRLRGSRAFRRVRAPQHVQRQQTVGRQHCQNGVGIAPVQA